MPNDNPASDIKKKLMEKKPAIDKEIEKVLPRDITEKYLKWLVGDTEFEFDCEALTGSLSKPVWDFLDRGGKRWRPYLFLLITKALGGEPEKVKDFVVIPELIHNGTIIVDDVEDKGELRRGEKSLHLKFGDDVAINAGNFIYYLPLRVIMDNKDNFDCDTLLRVYDIYAEEMINVSLGQGIDIYWHNLNKGENVSEGEYLQMCAFKTGCLARLSARLAAVLSGASREEEKKLGKLAEKIGIGFQIQDDILDIKSTEEENEEFGKEYGNDIKEGKKTLIVINALEKASERDKEALNSIISQDGLSKAEIDEAIGILRKYNAVKYAKKRAKELVSEAWEKGKDILPESEAKVELESFVTFLVERDI